MAPNLNEPMLRRLGRSAIVLFLSVVMLSIAVGYFMPDAGAVAFGLCWLLAFLAAVCEFLLFTRHDEP